MEIDSRVTAFASSVPSVGRCRKRRKKGHLNARVERRAVLRLYASPGKALMLLHVKEPAGARARNDDGRGKSARVLL